MHTLISGITNSGKTFLAKQLAKEFKKQKRGVLVLDVLNDNWDCHFKTTSPQQFLAVAKSNCNCALFIDESSVSIGRGVDARAMHWLATMSRHWGHRAYFILQRINQIEPIIRSQCTEFFCFRGSATDSKLLIEETGDAYFSRLPELPQYHFIHKKAFQNPKISVLKV